MANTNEGVFLLGVDDKTRDIWGIPQDKLYDVERLVRDICNDSIKPPVLVCILRILLPDALGQERAILKLDVPRSLFVHKSPSGYFHRIGSSKREMSPDFFSSAARPA